MTAWPCTQQEPPEIASFRRLAEDILILAAKVREGDDDIQLEGETSYFRVAEILVALAERLVALTGADRVWVPTAVRDMTELP